MKKAVIFFIVIVFIICGISYLYLNYKANINILKQQNSNFESFLNKETYGTDVATVINRAIDNNEKNSVQKNNKGIYISNDNNSINIEIKMIDNDSVYQMETIYKNGIDRFMNYYSNIKFKCVEINYHSSTNKVKYMLFEQITS